jgi:surface protein
MSLMFYKADAFNQDIDGWDVSKVTDMSGMFYKANTFNQAIDSWNVGKVTNMYLRQYQFELLSC